MVMFMSIETQAILVYMWIAFYDNNECFPQFDVETGRENMFGEIDQSRVKKFGLFPISEELAIKINQMNVEKNAIAESHELPYFILKLSDGQRLVYARRCKIHQYAFQICIKCGYEWQWMDFPEGIGEVGFPIHKDHIVQKLQNGKDIALAQCPKCKSVDYLMCPNCNEAINQSRSKESDPWYYDCPKCKKEYPRWIVMSGGIKREIAYVLGYQKTENEDRGGVTVPVNTKHLMIINKDGTFELSDR